MSRVFLVGAMGAGKSTVGRLLANRLGMPFVDLDDLVVEESGMPVDRLFAERGEQAFRSLETEALEAVCGREDAVVATGGGVVCRERNRELLTSSGVVVWLRVGPDESLSRIGDTSSRPMLGAEPSARARSLIDERTPHYRSLSDVTVDTDGIDAGEVARRVDDALRAVGAQGGSL